MERRTQYDWTANPAERKYREEMAWFIEMPVAGFKLPVPDQRSRPSMSCGAATKIRPLYSTSLAMGERYYIRLRSRP
jgi:hypothetical protein